MCDDDVLVFFFGVDCHDWALPAWNRAGMHALIADLHTIIGAYT